MKPLPATLFFLSFCYILGQQALVAQVERLEKPLAEQLEASPAKPYFKTNKQNRFLVGPRVGLNIAHYIGSEKSSTPVAGVAAGVFFNTRFFNDFDLVTEVLYGQKGAEVTNATTRYRDELHYLEFNLLPTLYFNPMGSTLRPKAYAGPSLAAAVYGRRTEVLDADGSRTSRQLSIGTGENADWKPYDLGLIVGGGMDYVIGKRLILTTDLRYTLGIPRIFAGNPQPAINNGVLTLSIGIGFMR